MNPQAKTIPGWVWIGVAGVVLFVATKTPSPGPLPPPGPNPPGPVSLEGSLLVCVTDNDKRTPDQAAVIEDADFIKWLADQKADWTVVDVGGSAFKTHGYDKVLAADALTAPALILMSKDRGSHRSHVFPNTVNDLKQWLTGNPHTGPPYIEVDGHKRYLTCLPPQFARDALPRGGKFSAVHAPIPRSQWKTKSLRSWFDSDKFLFDQDGIGSCVANGATGALMRARALQGMPYMRLAPGCLYSQINGGHDSGAVISDSLTALQKTGVCTSTTLGSDEKPYYTRQLPSGWQKEAARFKIEAAYKCANFDEIGTALQLGYVVVYGIQVGSNFNSFTPEGVAGVSRGPGNHCMHADGMFQLKDGTWACDNVNSWGATWGPWKNGRCGLVEQHFLNGDQPDAYAVQTSIEDPAAPKKLTERYKWIGTSDPDVEACYDTLSRTQKHVGSYRFSTGIYLPRLMNGWGPACEPPIPPPAQPEAKPVTYTAPPEVTYNVTAPTAFSCPPGSSS